ncbi:MAG: alanine racemase, partial [Oscillospiraceae bacterium]|nr:alanine racemase [Oscillospiraceae bacterium]
MNMQTYNSYLEIDLGQLLENAAAILGTLDPGTGLIPVLKDDAYGLGLVPVAKTLCTLPEIRMLAVAHVSEGLLLRQAGIDREILVMGGALPFQLEAACRAELTLACAHLGFAEALAAAAERVGKQGRLHIKIDTGLHRIGVGPEELEALARELRRAGD